MPRSQQPSNGKAAKAKSQKGKKTKRDTAGPSKARATPRAKKSGNRSRSSGTSMRPMTRRARDERTAIDRIPSESMRKIMRKVGVLSIGKDTVAFGKKHLSELVQLLVDQAVCVAHHAKRRILTAKDAGHVLEMYNLKVYGGELRDKKRRH